MIFWSFSGKLCFISFLKNHILFNMNINQKRRAVAVELCALNSLKEDDMEVSQRTQKRTE